MNKKISIIIFCLLLCGSFATKSFSQANTSQQASTDTPVVNVAKENLLIKEVVQSKTTPQKDKVQYFNQVTKYGFKNLFSHYDYNPSMSYTAQVNPNAEIFIRDYMKTHGRYLQNMKGWCRPYFNLIENILLQYGLPRELKYIAVIESSLKAGALSNKGACGPWQLMPGTAKRLGLTVNPYIDDRTDYYKSTNAAARYLLTLYGQFHDWLLVMAAYNGGAGSVLSAMQKSKSSDFWSLQFYLPEESRVYVKRFIATHYIMEGSDNAVADSNSAQIPDSSAIYFNNPDDASVTSYGKITGSNPYNKSPALSAKEKTDVQELSISGKYNSTVIAKNIEMDMVTFNHYNPHFDNMIATNGSYDLRLPTNKMQLFVTNKYPILNESVQLLLGCITIPDCKTTYPVKHAAKKIKNQ